MKTNEYKTFLVAYDFSEHAKAALYTATDLARRLDADLHLVHVVPHPTIAYGYGAYGGALAPPPMDMNETRQAALSALTDVADAIEGIDGKREAHVLEGNAVVDALVAHAEEIGADLIVMGTHGRTGLAHVFLGSVAERTLRRAPCPVLTVQAPEDDSGDG